MTRIYDDNRTVGAGDFHWAAVCRLVCIEGYATTAMHFTSYKQDCSLFPWVFFVMLELTVRQFVPEGTPDDLKTCRQLQKLGETLNHMQKPWSSWSDLLPASCFDASAQHHAVIQLATCVTAAAEVICKKPTRE